MGPKSQHQPLLLQIRYLRACIHMYVRMWVHAYINLLCLFTMLWSIQSDCAGLVVWNWCSTSLHTWSVLLSGVLHRVQDNCLAWAPASQRCIPPIFTSQQLDLWAEVQLHLFLWSGRVKILTQHLKICIIFVHVLIFTLHNLKYSTSTQFCKRTMFVIS